MKLLFPAAGGHLANIRSCGRIGEKETDLKTLSDKPGTQLMTTIPAPVMSLFISQVRSYLRVAAS